MKLLPKSKKAMTWKSCSIMSFMLEMFYLLLLPVACIINSLPKSLWYHAITCYKSQCWLLLNGIQPVLHSLLGLLLQSSFSCRVFDFSGPPNGIIPFAPRSQGSCTTASLTRETISLSAKFQQTSL